MVQLTSHLKGLRSSTVAPRFTQPCSRNWRTVLSFFVDKKMQPMRYSCQHGSSEMELGGWWDFWVSDQKPSQHMTVSSSRSYVQYCNTIILHLHRSSISIVPSRSRKNIHGMWSLRTPSSSGNVQWNVVAIVFNSQRLHFSRCSWKGCVWHLKYPFSFLCPSSCAYIPKNTIDVHTW